MRRGTLRTARARTQATRGRRPGRTLLRARAAELVFARALRRAALEIEGGLVVAGLDRDLAVHRLDALLAPGLDLVLARTQAAEREPAVLLGDDVVRRID